MEKPSHHEVPVSERHFKYLDSYRELHADLEELISWGDKVRFSEISASGQRSSMKQVAFFKQLYLVGDSEDTLIVNTLLYRDSVDEDGPISMLQNQIEADGPPEDQIIWFTPELHHFFKNGVFESTVVGRYYNSGASIEEKDFTTGFQGPYIETGHLKNSGKFYVDIHNNKSSFKVRPPVSMYRGISILDYNDEQSLMEEKNQVDILRQRLNYLSGDDFEFPQRP